MKNKRSFKWIFKTFLVWKVCIMTPVLWLVFCRSWLFLAAWISLLLLRFQTVKDWLVYTGTSTNGTAFGLQMSQAGFSAHNVEVSLAPTTTSTQIICRMQNNTHCLNFQTDHNYFPQPAIYHFPLTPEVPAVWPQKFRSSWFRPLTAFFHFSHAGMSNKTLLFPREI